MVFIGAILVSAYAKYWPKANTEEVTVQTAMLLMWPRGRRLIQPAAIDLAQQFWESVDTKMVSLLAACDGSLLSRLAACGCFFFV